MAAIRRAAEQIATMGRSVVDRGIGEEDTQRQIGANQCAVQGPMRCNSLALFSFCPFELGLDHVVSPFAIDLVTARSRCDASQAATSLVSANFPRRLSNVKTGIGISFRAYAWRKASCEEYPSAALRASPVIIGPSCAVSSRSSTVASGSSRLGSVMRGLHQSRKGSAECY
jgi:hypothetical protein